MLVNIAQLTQLMSIQLLYTIHRAIKLLMVLSS